MGNAAKATCRMANCDPLATTRNVAGSSDTGNTFLYNQNSEVTNATMGADTYGFRTPRTYLRLATPINDFLTRTQRSRRAKRSPFDEETI